MSTNDLAVSSDRPDATGSVRLRVARAALEAALDAPGVLGSDAGPSGLRLTADPSSGSLVGVSATAQADGRYAVDLSLVADMVPLPQLAEAVRDHVRKRARVEQLEDVLGSINVEFASVMTAEELAAAAAEKEVEEALAAEELAAALAVAEKAAESPAPRSGTTEPGIPDAGTAPERAEPAPDIEQRLAATSARATPPRRDAAALAARQAALAIEQAALAAKQAALAAEQAALAAGPGVALPPFESERATGSITEAGGERER